MRIELDRACIILLRSIEIVLLHAGARTIVQRHGTLPMLEIGALD
jgi:hypothetical protein